MAGNRKPLDLQEFIFGDSDETVQDRIPGRLLTWAEAFDQWLRELGAKYTPCSAKQARLTWRWLLQEDGKGRVRYPWTLGNIA